MTIRKARETDAPAIRDVHVASIRALCAAAYAPDLIEEWVGALAPARYLDPIRSLEFVVAEVEGRIVGFCILNLATGELHAIYLAPAAAGKGLGRRLMAWAEETATRHGWREMFLKATLNAVPFYEKCGFRAERMADQPLPSGTPRACVEMRKTLAAPPGGSRP